MNTAAEHTLVSIVMATYNGAAYLEQQLQSLLTQTYANLEIIICDDASTDRTQQIVTSFAEIDSRISYFFQPRNIGVNKNFEHGFTMASGDFIAITDQDDIWLKNKIEEQMKLFSEDKIILVHSASALFSNDVLPVNKLEKTSEKQMTGNDPRRLLLRNSISGHNIIFRKNLLQRALPLPSTLYYDWWLCEVAVCSGEIAATTKILAYQRKHENNVTVYTRTTAKQTRKEFIEREKALSAFITIPAMPSEANSFARQLLKKFSTLEHSIFSPGLFFFLLKHSPVLFFYKNKKFPFFSYLKTAYLMSFAVTN